MANFTVSLTATSLTVPAVAYRTTEGGRLKSIAVGYELTAPDWGRVFVQIGSMLGGTGLEYMVALFFQGYISGRGWGLWTGDYPFDPYEQVFIYAYAAVTRTIRVVGKVETLDC